MWLRGCGGGRVSGRIAAGEPPVRRALAVKSIARLAIVVGRDHGDRRQPIGTNQKAIVDALANEDVGQQRAETIARDAAQETSYHTEPGAANRDVEGRAYGNAARRP